MPSSKRIRAGRVFVELFADDSKLVRGLRAAERKIQALLPILELIVKAVVELFVEKANAPDTAAEADRCRARRDRLAQRVRQHKNPY